MSELPAPPRFVPTLTEVVDAATVAGAADVQTPATSGAAACANAVEAAAMRRLLQHIDLILENRLQEAVGKLVQTHSQALALQLRREVAEVVQECVSRAIDTAARANPGS